MRLILFIQILLLSFASLQAQQIRAYVSNERVRVGDELIVHVEVKGFHQKARPLFPIIKEANKRGRTQELSLQGGNLTIYSQAYVFKKIGVITFPSFEVRVDQELYKSTPLVTTVIAAPPKPDLTGEMPDISLEVFFDRDTIYIGEQVHLRMYLVIPEAEKGNVRVSDFAKSKLREGMPNKAFWEEKLPGQFTEVLSLERGGKKFLRYPLLETYLFPLQTGIFPFGDQYLTYELRENKEGATTSDILMGKSYKTIKMLQKAEPHDLIVLPVPQALAETAVGDLTLTAKVSTSEAATGEPFYMMLILEGKANFSTLPEPQFKLNPLFTYESPSVNYQFSFGDSSAKGQRTYTYQLTAAYPGNYNLGPIEYAYFDPLKKQMKKLKQKELNIEITGDELPEILTNSEGSFYFRAFQQASEEEHRNIPFLKYVSLLLVAFAIAGLVWGGKKIGHRPKGIAPK